MSQVCYFMHYVGTHQVRILVFDKIPVSFSQDSSSREDRSQRERGETVPPLVFFLRLNGFCKNRWAFSEASYRFTFFCFESYPSAAWEVFSSRVRVGLSYSQCSDRFKNKLEKEEVFLCKAGASGRVVTTKFQSFTGIRIKCP